MEINNTNPSNPLIGLNQNVQRIDSSQQAGRAQQSSGESPSSDRLELSVRSREMSHLQELAQSTPDVRDSRIEQIRGEIVSGTYNVKAEKIAQKIMGGNLLDRIF
jgi:negative regulator of flagellin synthesis FlgM